jgi:hypothetical protein
MTYLSNSLSINMIGFSQLGEAKVFIARLTPGAARKFLAGVFVSAVGHESTAALIAADLGLDVRARVPNKKARRAGAVSHGGGYHRVVRPKSPDHSLEGAGGNLTPCATIMTGGSDETHPRPPHALV